MKKILVCLTALILFSAISGFCASGNQETYHVITSSGLTAIEFEQDSTEIYIVAVSTDAAYCNFTSTSATTNDFLIGRSGLTDVIDHTNEIRSSKMSVYTEYLPVHIRIKVKYW